VEVIEGARGWAEFFLTWVASPAVLYGTWVLRDIRNQLRILNGRMIRVETWRDEHEKLDDERHRENVRRLEEITRAVGGRGR